MVVIFGETFKKKKKIISFDNGCVTFPLGCLGLLGMVEISL